MLQLDSATLTKVINCCFTLSATAGLAEAEKRTFLVAGKQLRGSLVNLLSAQFDDGTQAVLDANGELSKVNAEADELIQGLGKASELVKKVTDLAGKLDKLLPLAARFL